jgi:uncharacterized protein with von Willebrand factor type A (vWA) domain
VNNELSSPLAEIIRRAAAKEVKGPASKIMDRMKEATDEVIVLADTSSSMLDWVGHSGMSKEEHLIVALKDVLKRNPKVRIIAFSDMVREMKVEDIEKGHGRQLGCGTNLAAALRFAAPFKPRKTIIVSDGCPNNEKEAEAEAAKITGAIDCVYCGPDDHPAVSWLQSLSRSCGGFTWSWNGDGAGTQSLSGMMMLALPAPSGVK